RRIVRNLQGKGPKPMFSAAEPHILVAHNLTPSDTATMNRELVLGIATDLGSRTSHTAIIARSLNIPAVVGLHDATEKLESSQHVLLDGYTGVVIVDPTPETLSYYGEVQIKKGLVAKELRQLRETSSTTSDGRHMVLSANIELPTDVESVAENGAEGIGLYRTEFLFVNRDTLPSEEEQYETYRKVAEQVKPNPLIIRTFDLGGDKLAAGVVDAGDELNPFLGWRAIRFCLENIDIFKTQLRAFLRASAVDRVNERIAHLYEPTHPAVLRLLKMIADAAHANKIWVGVCGEMARDVATIPILIGLGMDELSVGATSVPRVKMAVQSLAVPECQELVDEVLGLQTSSEILAR